MSPLDRWFPWLIVGAAVLYLGVMAVPPKDPPGRMAVQEFGKIVVSEKGRFKPLDSVARNALLVISHRQTFLDADGNSGQPAARWLLDTLVSSPEYTDRPATRYKVFRIDNDQIINMLKLEPRPLFWRYAVSEFADKLPQISERATAAEKIEPKQRDVFNGKIIELAQHLQMFINLSTMESVLALPPRSPGGEWQSYAKVTGLAREMAGAKVRGELERQGLNIEKMDRAEAAQWVARFQEEIVRTRDELNPHARTFADMLRAYQAGNVEAFNKLVAAHRKMLRERFPEETATAELETYFNHLSPFYHSAILYCVVFLLALCGLFGWSGPLNRAAFWLGVLILAVHTVSLIARMYIQGRPPVTDLYSSAVFIGWGGVLLSLFMERVYRNGLGNLVAALMGALTMLVAHHLAQESGETLKAMEAVLDTNIWLATHVTIVTLGYVATFVAGLLGAIYIIEGVLTRALTAESGKTLAQMIYGVVCFAVLLSFVGTVLGGIWADQSWGRFWGWDPKENGALLIVIWNALILHARWAGMIKQRGLAVLAVVGNMVTAWSWFGTNQLSVGLHAYGFNDQLAAGLVTFWLTQLAIIGLGLTPPAKWRSFAASRTPASPAQRKQREPRVGPATTAAR